MKINSNYLLGSGAGVRTHGERVKQMTFVHGTLIVYLLVSDSFCVLAQYRRLNYNKSVTAAKVLSNRNILLSYKIVVPTVIPRWRHLTESVGKRRRGN